MKNIIYCYSKCSTCKKALKWLDNNNVKYELKDIINDHPDIKQMNLIINNSQRDINTFFNTSGILYRELKLKDKLKTLSFEAKLNLLVSNGKLIKRPLFINENQVFSGFKEEVWQNELLN
ncbi:MAG: Spx/MgsR family RNA polymerase-binding regulatory protein [Bacilli bacterium]|nr:Spx/MgsR family RNA polymerase-binding regulatory protein [Bacilli bacterium]